MAILNNNAFSTILKNAYKQFTGEDLTGDASALTLKDVVDTGTTDKSLAEYTEQFFKSLLVTSVKLWFTDSAYRSQYVDKWLLSEEEYGGIVQSLTIEAPDVRESGAFINLENGVTTLTDNDTFFTAKITNRLYGKSVSWELPIMITEVQMRDAFESASGLQTLVSYIMTCVNNKILVHLDSCSMMNKCNYLAEKINYANGEDAEGTHVVNIVEEYCRTFGIDSMTKEEFQKDADALRWSAKRFGHYVDRFKRDTVNYNVGGFHRFTPNERIVLEVNSDFIDTVESVAYSGTFHEDYVKLPLYSREPYWQFAEEGVDENGDANSMKINVQIAPNVTVNAKNIVAFLADKWAIRHVYVETFVAHHRFDRNRIDAYYYQHKDKYENDLSMNAIVFIMDDYTA